jgi:hypothetical protein
MEDKYQGTDEIWQSGSSPLGGPAGTEKISCFTNSNQDPRKRQPISTVHTKGYGQSKVAYLKV